MYKTSCSSKNSKRQARLYLILHEDWGRRREGEKTSTSRKESVGQKKTKRKLAEALPLLQTHLQVPGQELERHLTAQ